jgi:hypothetical protein
VADWTASGVEQGIHIRDNDIDGFRVWDGEIGNLPSGLVPTGQSFWVRSINATPSLTIHESAKRPFTHPELFRNRIDVTSLQIDLKKDNQQDNTFIKFNSAGEGGWQKNRDTIKKKNGFFNVSILSSDGHSMAIKNLCDTLCSQEVGVFVQPQTKATYSLTVSGSAFDNVVDRLYLIDNFAKDTTEWKEGEPYVFQVTADSRSFAKDRFRLIIEKAVEDQPVISLQDGLLIASGPSDVQWMLNGVDIPGATDAIHHPLEEGEYSVRTTGKSCNKVSAIFSYRVTSSPETSNERIGIYPNPASSTVEIIGLKPGPVQYEVTTTTGANLEQGSLLIDGAFKTRLSVASLSDGLYILKVHQGDKVHQFKLVIR